ncbi:MAG: glycoside hydrolase family 28 protein [Prevotella sp.]|nr:glycoside hydrolase family 28 protein [Prevotella sp.]
MSKLLNVIAACLLLPVSMEAQDYSKYYQNLPVEMTQVSRPVIPNRGLSINAVGGVGDGVTLNTEAFRKGISMLSKQGGGRLTVPAGVWLTGPIVLKDNIELYLDKNAIIYFSPDKSLYVDKEGKSSRVEPCIKASKRKNIAITGSGIIDGNGAQWRPVKRGKVSDVEWNLFKSMGGVERQNGTLWYPWELKSGYPDIKDTPEKQEKMRNDLVRFTDCENVLFEGVTFQNAPKFHVHPCYCKNVIVDGITVRCPWNAQNGDAIDFSDVNVGLIVNATVDAGDDGLCMKSGKPRANSISGCEDILIQDNTVYHAHGAFVLGSETAAGMRRIVVRNCRFSGTDTGLRFKSGIGRGGKTEQLYISDVVMADIKDEAIVFQCDYVDRPAGADDKAIPTFTEEQKRWAPNFQDIHISNVVCRGTRTGIKAAGILGLDCVHDIDISDCTILYDKTPQQIDESTAKLRLSNVKLLKNEKEKTD